MEPKDTPNSIDELIAALADGELDLRENPGAMDKIAQDPQSAQRLAYQHQLREACGRAMDGPEMKCPEALAGRLLEIASADVQSAQPLQPAQPTKPPAYPSLRPPVLARIGRWAPTAVAAVLLLAAGVLFMQANSAVSPGDLRAASLIPVDQVAQFTGRHGDCALDPARLEESKRFGDATEFDQLPGKLANYFQTTTDGMHLSLDGIGYDYQLTGACGLPGKGAVHIVYRNHQDPDRAISVWVMPAREAHAVLEEGRVYSETGGDLLHPVIYWRQGDLLYYLVGDSLEDCDKAVKALRASA